jgi:hypothetical protein
LNEIKFDFNNHLALLGCVAQLSKKEEQQDSFTKERFGVKEVC